MIMFDIVKEPSKKDGETIKRVIPFSPPDIGENEIDEVIKALKSGWITTGPRTKLLEQRIAAYIGTGKVDVDIEAENGKWENKVVCLNSATAAEELNFRILGIKEGDEVIVSACTYTASASAAIHCGAKVVFVDIQKDGDAITHMPEMDYEALELAINEKITTYSSIKNKTPMRMLLLILVELFVTMIGFLRLWSEKKDCLRRLNLMERHWVI